MDNEAYATAANQHQRLQEIDDNDLVLVQLRRESNAKGTYHKLNSESLKSTKSRSKSTHAYLIEQPLDRKINPIVNVSDLLYSFEGFDREVAPIKDKVIKSRRGNQYGQFLVKQLVNQQVKAPGL